MIFNEIKCHINTSLGLVGGCIPFIPPVSALGIKSACDYWQSKAHKIIQTIEIQVKYV